MVALSVTTVSAQENIVYGGLGLPQGKFGGDDAKESMYLADKSEGSAGLGLNVGFKMLQPISPELSWFISGDIFYNGLNSDVKEEWEDAIDKADGELVSTPSYLNIPVMGGVNYTVADMGNMSIFAEAGIGFNARLITKGEYNEKVTYGTDTYKLEVTEEFDNSFGLAFQLGAGVKINDQFIIGLNYYKLGSDKVKGKAKYEIDGDSDSDDFKSSKKLDVSLLAVRFGFVF